ncbi:MAG: UDP-N-acetylmuramoyl-L-alanyl-D-glutamate--2,6-diaminopimelate ligase [Candidatus Omnitrophica bacterium]|nr:UDP-N-acetylmuramoyl-L-alanyl-D-glutamate--2,6-diaminopimelate ligase [Candidatus Omnitrophota bacterium]
MRLKDIFEGMSVTADPALLKTDIKSVTANSKVLKRGDLFVAIEGTRVDGHEFVNEALKKGARACVVNESKIKSFKRGKIVTVRDTRKALSVAAKNFYHSPAEKLKVIGITGTNGKTTSALLVESIFNKSGMPCGVIGTIEYKTGNRRIAAERTTPDALSLNALLDKMLKSGLKAAVMEVSSHALDQKRVDDIFFDVALFTNLTREHLDYHGNLETYFKSKAKIFSRIKARGIAIINNDDNNAKRIREIVKCERITYGLDKDADIAARVKSTEPGGSSFDVKIQKKYAFCINTKLVGLHNVSNILAAIAVGISQGIDKHAIKRGIETVNSIRGRLEAVEKGQDFRIFIDYAHTHDALENVLKFLNHIKRRNIITVFGCGGDRDRTKRPLMGQVAQKLSDFVILTNDNPRNEDPKRIIRDVEGGMERSSGNYIVALDRKKAIEKALKKAKKNDIVLIAGKGHETEQVLADRRISFDDKKIAEGILKTTERPMPSLRG